MAMHFHGRPISGPVTPELGKKSVQLIEKVWDRWPIKAIYPFFCIANSCCLTHPYAGQGKPDSLTLAALDVTFCFSQTRTVWAGIAWAQAWSLHYAPHSVFAGHLPGCFSRRRTVSDGKSVSQAVQVFIWSNKPSKILRELWVFEFVIMGWNMIENISYGRVTNWAKSNSTHNVLPLPTLALMLEIYCYGNEGCCFSNCFNCSNSWCKMDWVNKVHFENLSLYWDLYQIKYGIRIGKFEIGA